MSYLDGVLKHAGAYRANEFLIHVALEAVHIEPHRSPMRVASSVVSRLSRGSGDSQGRTHSQGHVTRGFLEMALVTKARVSLSLAEFRVSRKSSPRISHANLKYLLLHIL